MSLYLYYLQNFQLIALILIQINLLLIAILIWKNYQFWSGYFKNISLHSKLLLSLLILLFFFLTFYTGFNFKTFIPSDEEWHSILQAKQIIEGKQVFAHTRYGLVYPFILSLGFRMFGFTPLVASILNFICTILSILLIFAISQLIFQNETISLISSYIYAFTPLVFIFTSFQMGFPAIITFVLLLFVFTALLYFKYHTIDLLFLTLLLINIISQIKPEYFIIFIPFIIFFILSRGFQIISFKQFIIILIICCILGLPYAIKIIFLKNSYSNNWCGFISQPTNIFIIPALNIKLISYLDHLLKSILNNRFSIINFISDIPNFISFWTLPSFKWLLIFLFIGIIISFNKFPKQSLFLITLFLFISFIYLSDCAYYESRYAIPSYSLLVYFEGFGIYFVSQFIAKKLVIFKKRLYYKYFIIILILICGTLYWVKTDYYNYIVNKTYKDHLLTRTIQDDYHRILTTLTNIDKINSNLLVVHNNEQFIAQFLGYNAFSLANIPEINKFQINKFTIIQLPFDHYKNNYFLESWYCNTLINLQAACNYIKANYKLTLIQDNTLDKVYLFR